MQTSLRSCLTDIGAAAGRLLPLAGGLAALCALAEGTGVLMLAPMLMASGLLGGEMAGAPGWMGATAAALGFEGLLLAWLAAVAAFTGLNAWRDRIVFEVHERAAGRMRLGLHDALTRAGWAAFQSERASDVTSAMTVQATRVGFGAQALVQLFSMAVLIAAQMAVAFAVIPSAVTAALLAGAAMMAVQLPRLRRTLAKGRGAVSGAQAFQAMITDHLGGLKLAKAHGAEAALARDFAEGQERWAEGQRAAYVAHAGSRALGKLMAAVILTAVAWFAVRQAELPAASLLVLTAVMARLFNALGGAAHQMHLLTEMLPNWLALEALRQRLAQAAEDAEEAGAAPPVGSVDMDDLWFRWPGRDRPALAGVSLTVAENATTALIGPSGAGKSTLADLALGLLEPERGTIRVGGQVLAGAAVRAWRHSVAYVPQDGFLLHASVRANLSWLAPSATEGEMWECLDLAAAREMVARLPQGLDTVVGDRGVRLSGGERQRLALARALLRRPRFLVLDEATSHLDRDNERLVQDALARLHGRLTVLVIAHRLETVRQADHIAVIEDGRVREQGRWDGLDWLARHGGELA